jgi:hypothetical protein
MSRYMKRYEDKVREGAERNEAWRKLTPSQQLADLNRRLGLQCGATRQRKKLEGK